MWLINCLFNTINLVLTLLILFYKPSILEWHQNVSSEASKVSPQLTLSFIWFLNFIFPRSASIMVLSRQWRQNSLYQLNFIPLFDDRHLTTSVRSEAQSEETWPGRCKINHSHWSALHRLHWPGPEQEVECFDSNYEIYSVFSHHSQMSAWIFFAGINQIQEEGLIHTFDWVFLWTINSL